MYIYIYVMNEKTDTKIFVEIFFIYINLLIPTVFGFGHHEKIFI